MNKNGPACIVIGIIIGVNGKATYGWMGGAVTGCSVYFLFSVFSQTTSQSGAEATEAPGGMS